MQRLHVIMTVIVTAQFILFLLGYVLPKDKKSAAAKKEPFYTNIIYVVVCCFLIIEIIAAIPKKGEFKNPFESVAESRTETRLLDFQDYLDKYKDMIITIVE